MTPATMQCHHCGASHWCEWVKQFKRWLELHKGCAGKAGVR